MLQQMVAAEGLLIPAANGGMKANPAQRSLETARAQAHRLLTEFGLTPKSRNYVQKAPEPSADNDFRPMHRQRDDGDEDFRPM